MVKPVLNKIPTPLARSMQFSLFSSCFCHHSLENFIFEQSICSNNRPLHLCKQLEGPKRQETKLDFLKQSVKKLNWSLKSKYTAKIKSKRIWHFLKLTIIFTNFMQYFSPFEAMETGMTRIRLVPDSKDSKGGVSWKAPPSKGRVCRKSRQMLGLHHRSSLRLLHAMNCRAQSYWILRKCSKILEIKHSTKHKRLLPQSSKMCWGPLKAKPPPIRKKR